MLHRMAGLSRYPFNVYPKVKQFISLYTQRYVNMMIRTEGMVVSIPKIREQKLYNFGT